MGTAFYSLTEVIPQGFDLNVIASDGVTLKARVYGPSDGVRLILSHGNGLAINGYSSFWAPLIDTFQVVVFDMRSHGCSERCDAAHHNWDQFSDDLEILLKTTSLVLGARKTVGVFHSLSAIVALNHARRFHAHWDGLLLFDPPLMPPDGHPLQASHLAEMHGLAARVRRRRVCFDSPRELAEQFAKQAIFCRWQNDAYEVMARALLRQDTAGGGWALTCPPEFEARTFETNSDTTLWSWLQSVPFPLKIVCADPSVEGVQPSAQIGRAAAQELGLEYEFVAQTTHFLQVERPDACGDIARAFCSEHM